MRSGNVGDVNKHEEVWYGRTLVLLKDEQQDVVCRRCLVHGEWMSPTMSDWVWWLVVSLLVPTCPISPSPGKDLGQNGDPVGKTS